MQPTPPAPTPAPASEPVTELVRTQRQNVGYALLVASAVCLALTGWLVLKTSRLSAPAADATKGAKDKDKADDPLAVKPIDTEIVQPNRTDYVIGAVIAFAGCVSFGGVGAYLMAGRVKPTVEEQRTEARVLVLVLGSALGAALILLGALYFYQWSESLTKWLDKNDLAEAKWVLTPLLIVVVGGGLMFAAAQPARAEERNNSSVRQFIYGSNFGLTVLMLFVVLVIANAVIALRVPNKLDTTKTGFYTISPQTRQLLETLEQPVQAYAIFQDNDTIAEDLKQLLTICQEVNPGKFRVTSLSPALNKAEIAKLRSEFSQAEASREGVLLVVGEEGAERRRHSFIRGDEFEETKADAEGRQLPVFNGEGKLLRELVFLAESKQKPKVYFTQSSGELSLGAKGRRADARRSAGGLKAYLEKNYFEVAELNFELAGPAKVPDDAAVLVIADPTAPLPPTAVEAVRKYMSDPRPNGTKGKLVVLAGAQAGENRKPLVLGIEPVLETFGVKLADRFLYAQPNPRLAEWDRGTGSRVQLALVNPEAVEARNPVAIGFNRLDQSPLLDCRELTSQPAGGFQAVTVLVSAPGRVTWAPPEAAGSPATAWDELVEATNKILKGPGTDQEKQTAAIKLQSTLGVSRSPRELAVFVSEGNTARVAVFGCGWFVSDDAGATASDRFGARGANVWLDLMGSTLDWVRDRPVVSGPTEKPYTVYQLKPGYDSLRMLWVPLGLALVSVAGLGAGVWVIRRK